MSEGDGRADLPEQPDLLELARDWITLWQSELSALATDREAQEAWQKLISLWAGTASALLAPAASPAGSGERSNGHARAAAAAGTAAVAASPDPRDAEIERLRGRVDTLERRLADVERGRRSTGGNARRGAGGRGNKPQKP